MTSKNGPDPEEISPRTRDSASGSTGSRPQSGQKQRVTPEQRWRMIEEAAYYRAERRGFLGDQLADDWSAAEAEIDEHYQVDLAQTMRERDVNKLIAELTKAFSGPRFGGIDVGEVLKAQRENFEALAFANQQALEGAQRLLIRQAEILRHALQDASDSIKALTQSSGTADLVKKQEAILQAARERALAEMRETAEIVAQSQARALNRVRRRMQQELTALAERLRKAIGGKEKPGA